MTSNDLIIIDAINGLESKIVSLQQDVKDIRQEMKEIRQEIRVNSIKIEGVQNSVNWGFAGMTIAITAVIAIVGLIATLAPTVREFFASKQQKFITEEKVKSMIETAITNALAGKLR